MARQSVSLDAGSEGGAATPRIIVERPAPGLARGNYAWPPWAIGLAGGMVLAVACAYFAWRWRAQRKK